MHLILVREDHSQSSPLENAAVESSHIHSETDTIEKLLHIYNEYKERALSSALIAAKFNVKCVEAAMKMVDEGKIETAFQSLLLPIPLVVFDETHPLYNLEQAIDNGKKLQLNPIFGAHFSGLGGAIVKGGHIRADTRNIEGTLRHCIQFKINDFARKDVNDVVNCIQQSPILFEKHSSHLFPRGITITRVPYIYREKNENGIYILSKKIQLSDNESIQIEFHGLGKIIIGNKPQNGCLYNNIDIELDATLSQDQGLSGLNAMLCSLGLGAALTVHSEEDDERIKITKIFRIFCPKEASQLERTRDFYFMAPSKLQELCEQISEAIKPIFRKYLSDSPKLIEKESIYPGRSIWSIKDFSQQLRQKEAYGLIAGISGDYVEIVPKLTALLKNGAFSTQDRFQAGIMVRGSSYDLDFSSGGGDRVFTRLVNSRNAVGQLSDHKVQVLYDLDVLNRGGYAYMVDSYGIKNPFYQTYKLYQNRLNLIEFTENLPQSNGLNEVMIKNRIEPKFIKGIIVSSKVAKDFFVGELSKEGLIKDESILGKPVDEFIHIADSYNQKMWD